MLKKDLIMITIPKWTPHAVAGIVAVITCAVASATETLKLPSFNPTPKYCLFITVDGMDQDYITSGIMPNLAAWAPAGASLPGAINVYPTATTPNMTSLHTGAWPITTGVGGNIVFFKNEYRVANGPRTNRATTLAEAFKAAGHSTAGVQQYMLQKRGADRYLHTRNADSHGITTTALSMLADKQSVPNLMVVLYQEVDHTGHVFGPGSPQLSAQAGLVDEGIASLVSRYAELDILQDTLVVISADHGMSLTDKKIELAALNKELATLGMTYEWLIPKKPVKNKAVDFYLLEAGNLQGYFNRQFSPEEQERLFAAITRTQGFGRLMDSTTLRRMNCDPSGGDFVVEPALGWRLRKNPGTHGTQRESYGYQAFFGAGVKPGAKIINARTIDLMPTVLKAFKIAIPDTVDGRPLNSGLLR